MMRRILINSPPHQLTNLHTKSDFTPAFAPKKISVRERAGFTLIEMVAVIVLLGIAIPPLMTTWADITWRSSRSESIADASFYTQELMEEIKSKRFDEQKNPPYTSSSNFNSTDTGENKNNKNTFDDVDDFAGCADPAVTTPASGYSRAAAVDYVRLNTSNNTWENCGTVSSCNSSVTDCATCNQCCFKQITVSVSSNNNLVRNANLKTIVSAH